ncbi:TetR family transcriptional regulator [Silvimonas amylolytica]|uniref:DNA-binding transcriptional repressor AcrR n=1 Tax=Silvimonas amylolytica TaxID=449663 RepID=A0ABQ2PNQ2_9NEIS|nr:TetR family transcriptional regulator [Silvimonas amylolytica]GGP26594.1 DNA-binding transcriptional repressor AcrR [Silvimonas amylolytica]
MARKTKEEAAETREHLLDTAERIFSAKGVSRTSLADIADAAGLTRGAIYWHFENKADLFNAMADRICLPLEQALEPDETGHYSEPLTQLREALIKTLADTDTDERQRRGLDVLMNKCEYTEDLQAVLDRRREAMLNGTQRRCSLLRQAIERGQLPPDLDVARADRLLIGALCGLLNNWLFMPDSFSLRDEAAPLIDALLETLQLGRALRQNPAD